MFTLLRLKVRKKTSAAIASMGTGILCLWAIASWQNITWSEILTILLGTFLMLGGIMLAAFLLIAGFKLAMRAISREDTETESD